MGKGKAKVGCEVKGPNRDFHVDSRNCISHALPPNTRCGYKNELYKQVWRACAGSLINIPSVWQKVVYFPQGHLEQVEPFMKQDDAMEMPVYNLPSKIFCTVVNVELKAEAGTDEVFAQITLLPETKQDVRSLKEDGNSVPLPQQTHPRSFSKKLTSSDTSTHGGLSVLKRHAEECLPYMDVSGKRPEQKLVAKDLHGFEWSFRHVYRGQPKRHLLTTGWSTFVTSKKLLPGDVFIFLRGENGELRIGIRRAIKQQSSASTSVISARSMQIGIMATALHAINPGTMFTVYYRPWTNPTEFIIPLDQYLESAEMDYSVGTRFRMLFEDEECAEQRIERFEGTIAGNEDIDHIRWPNSEWKNLKVEWDATLEGFASPDRVSHWNIEAIEPIKKHSSPLHPSKRARAMDDASLSGLPGTVKDGLQQGPVEYATPNHVGVFQGQEKRHMGVNGLGALESPTLPHLVTQNPESNNQLLGSGNQPCFSAHGPFHPCPSGTIKFSGGNITKLGHPNSSSSYGVPENASGNTNLSVLKVNSSMFGCQDCRTLERKNANETPCAPPKCIVFGVDLVQNPLELPSPQVTAYSDRESLCFVPTMSQSSVSEPNKSMSGADSENQCKNCYSATNLSSTKVFKHGAAGRSVNLTEFDGYGKLIRELDQMFDFKGSLIDGSSGCQVTYDDEGDVMLIGDCSWKIFQCTVRRMFICHKEDIDKLNPRSPKTLPMQ